MPKGYVVVQLEVKDPERFAQYGKAVPATIEQHGGRYLVRGGELEVIEGDGPLPRIVILEFPSMAAAKAWYHSDEYQAIIGIRFESSVSHGFMVEGYIPPA